MNALTAYPPFSPRILARTRERAKAKPYVAACSSAATVRWRIAQSRALGGWLWHTPSRDIAKAWDVGASFLANRSQTIIGVLSEPGPRQRLTLIPEDEDIVVKVGIHSSAAAVVQRECESLAAVRATPWCGMAPALRLYEGASRDGRAVLLMEHVRGTHPRWDDKAVHAMLLHSLSGGARHLDISTAGLAHGDVTPWNVIKKADGSIVLLDWEFADFSKPVHPICGLLDYILRGAIVARARPRRVSVVLRDAFELLGVSSSAAVTFGPIYSDYRALIGELMGGSEDTLAFRVQQLFRRCFDEAESK